MQPASAAQWWHHSEVEAAAEQGLEGALIAFVHSPGHFGCTWQSFAARRALSAMHQATRAVLPAAPGLDVA